MRVSVLASGSRGNSTYIETDNLKILVDLGTTSKYIENKLAELGVSPSSIDYILLTHDHSDHTSALKTFVRKYKTKVLLTEKLKPAIDNIIVLENYLFLEKENILLDLEITSFKTSHDAVDSIGLIFKSNSKSIVYITDTGYINVKYFSMLKNHNMYIMESNHDIEKLLNGKYRYDLKVRILGDSGHLSNEMSSDYLKEFVGDKTEKIILIHLSEENNEVSLAYQMLKNKISDKEIIIASQNERTDLIDV